MTSARFRSPSRDAPASRAALAPQRNLAFCEVSSRVRAVLWRSNATVLCRRGRVRGGDLLRGHDPAACGLSPDLEALGPDPGG